MTTVAYAAGILASDSVSTAGSLRMSHVRKLARSQDGAIGGGAGCVVGVAAYLRWIEDGAIGEPDVGEGVSGLLVRADGSVWLAEHGGPLTRIEAPYHAAGSGAPVALGAMAAGAGAVRAVEIACALDTGSGGPVQVLRLEPVALPPATVLRLVLPPASTA